MASINGISFKAVKSFTGREGYGFTANVYLGKKRVGEVSDDAQGGPLNIYIDREYREALDKEVNAFLATEPENVSLRDEEDFFNHLYELFETEKTYKSNSKRGYPVLTVFHFIPKTKLTNEEGYIVPAKMIGSTTVAAIQSKIQEEKPVYTEIYTSLEDFVIEQR